MENKPLTIVGNGNQKRDFTYVTDVIDAFYKAASTKLSGHVFNLGTGSPKSINYLVKIIGGKKTYIPKRPGEPNTTCANPNKIRKLLKWKPKVKFENGVHIMLNEIKKWKSAPLWTPEKIKKATKLWFGYMKDVG